MRNSLCGRILSGLACLLALGVGLAGAVDFKTLESRGVRKNYAARTSVVSSHTVTGILIGWSVYAVGGTADFEVKHATHTGQDPNVHVSSTMYVLAGQVLSDKAEAIVANPVLLITRIDTPGTTVYVDMSYLQPRMPGDF